MAQGGGRALVYPSASASHPEQAFRDEINELKAPLIAIGVPDNVFIADVFIAAGYLSYLVASYLKLFSAYPDPDELEQVLNIGITNGFFNAISNVNARTFYRLCSYLHTPAGKTALAEVARQNRVLKEPSEDALVNMFEAQGIDYAKALVEAMHEHEVKIKDLEVQLEKTIQGLKKEYAPYATYNDIIGCDLSTSCWKEFSRKYYEEGSQHLHLRSPAMNLVFKTVAPIIRNKDMLNYINDGYNKRKLVEYSRRTNTGLNIRDS